MILILAIILYMILGVSLHGSAKMKVPDGKMLEVKLEYNTMIESIQILGDFFLYPDTLLREIENQLVGTSMSESEESIRIRISGLVKAKNATMIGITPEAIASVVKRAMTNEMEGNQA